MIHKSFTIIVLWFIKAYQHTLRPTFATGCYFYPSCSEYARLKVESVGVLRAFPAIVWRLLRCHPIGKSSRALTIDMP